MKYDINNFGEDTKEFFVTSRKKLYSLEQQLETEVASREVSMFDIIVKNGYIVDGTGSSRFRADVGIRGGKIAKIGSLGSEESESNLDVKGLIVSPGFVDMHSHSDLSLLINPARACWVKANHIPEVMEPSLRFWANMWEKRKS